MVFPVDNRLPQSFPRLPLGRSELIPYEEGKAASSPAEDEAFGGPHYVASEEMTKSNIANGKEVSYVPTG